MKKIWLPIFVLFLSFSSFAQSANVPSDCSILHKGEFFYTTDKDNRVKVVIDSTQHTEYHNNGAYYIKSTLKWTSSCSYEMTMNEVTIPNFPFKPGDVMTVKVIRINGKNIYYTSIVKGNTWNGILTKVK
jgi:hypothetical protein